MQLLTLDILGNTLFGFDFQALRHPESEHVTTYYTAHNAALDSLYIAFPILDRFPVGKRSKEHQAVGKFRSWLGTLATAKAKSIQQSCGDGDKPQDILSVLVRAWLDEKLTIEELLDELVTLILSGHDTTASALTSVIYVLATHPEIQAKVREEANREFSLHTSSMDIPSTAEIKALWYLEATIKETMRLYPPAPLLPTRTTAHDTMLGQMPIPKGSLVTLNIYALHRDEKYWENPTKLDPDRWLTTEGLIRDPPAWNPFTNGSRMCIAKGFALTEMKIVISMLVRTYHFSLPNDSPHNERLLFGSSLVSNPRNLGINYRKLSK
ncbi:RNA polymerase C-22 sterol desaturase [Basidiobolus ranarum]|uniref:RNA polymerase C-22 sterol desaturase n=1 Tax=Basidiobolus ranarum TaxID=34480 RepID=A0ABR2WH48_9FUNG